MHNYKSLGKQYPNYISLDELSRICKISKRSARYLVENKIIPAIDTGKITWRYQISINDVITYLRDREKQGSMIPPGAVTSHYRRKNRVTSNRKSFSQLVEQGQAGDIVKYFKLIYADYDEVLSAPDVIEMTGLNKSTILKLLKSGKIKSLSQSPRYLIPKKYLMEYVASRQYLEARTNSEQFRKILGGFEIWKTAKSSQ
jgi:hypothetical protein